MENQCSGSPENNIEAEQDASVMKVLGLETQSQGNEVFNDGDGVAHVPVHARPHRQLVTQFDRFAGHDFSDFLT